MWFNGFFLVEIIENYSNKSRSHKMLAFEWAHWCALKFSWRWWYPRECCLVLSRLFHCNNNDEYDILMRRKNSFDSRADVLMNLIENFQCNDYFAKWIESMLFHIIQISWLCLSDFFPHFYCMVVRFEWSFIANFISIGSYVPCAVCSIACE